MTKFREKYGGSQLRTLRIKSWTQEGGSVRYYDDWEHELREAVQGLIVAGMNLEAECDNSENAQMLRCIGIREL